MSVQTVFEELDYEDLPYFFQTLGSAYFGSGAVKEGKQVYSQPYYKPLVVSSLYGITFFANQEGVFVLKTAELLNNLKSSKTKNYEPLDINSVGGKFVNLSSSGVVPSLALSHDENILSVFFNTTLYIYNVSELLENPECEAAREFAFDGKQIIQVAWNPVLVGDGLDSRYQLLIVLQEAELKLVELYQKKSIQKETIGLQVSADCVCWSDKGDVAVIADGKEVVFLSIDQRQVLKRYSVDNLVTEEFLKLQISSVTWLGMGRILFTYLVSISPDEIQHCSAMLLWKGVLNAQNAPSSIKLVMLVEFMDEPRDFISDVENLKDCLLCVNCQYLSAWNVVVISSRYSSLEYVTMIQLPSLKECFNALPKIAIVEDGLEFMLPNAPGGSSNYVTALDLDLSQSSKKTKHPKIAEKADLQGCPVVLCSTTDGGIVAVTFGWIGEPGSKDLTIVKSPRQLPAAPTLLRLSKVKKDDVSFAAQQQLPDFGGDSDLSDDMDEIRVDLSNESTDQVSTSTPSDTTTDVNLITRAFDLSHPASKSSPDLRNINSSFPPVLQQPTISSLFKSKPSNFVTPSPFQNTTTSNNSTETPQVNDVFKSVQVEDSQKNTVKVGPDLDKSVSDNLDSIKALNLQDNEEIKKPAQKDESENGSSVNSQQDNSGQFAFNQQQPSDNFQAGERSGFSQQEEQQFDKYIPITKDLLLAVQKMDKFKAALEMDNIQEVMEAKHKMYGELGEQEKAFLSEIREVKKMKVELMQMIQQLPAWCQQQGKQQIQDDCSVALEDVKNKVGEIVKVVKENQKVCQQLQKQTEYQQAMHNEIATHFEEQWDMRELRKPQPLPYYLSKLRNQIAENLHTINLAVEDLETIAKLEGLSYKGLASEAPPAEAYFAYVPKSQQEGIEGAFASLSMDKDESHLPMGYKLIKSIGRIVEAHQETSKQLKKEVNSLQQRMGIEPVVQPHKPLQDPSSIPPSQKRFKISLDQVLAQSDSEDEIQEGEEEEYSDDEMMLYQGQLRARFNSPALIRVLEQKKRFEQLNRKVAVPQWRSEKGKQVKQFVKNGLPKARRITLEQDHPLQQQFNQQQQDIVQKTSFVQHPPKPTSSIHLANNLQLPPTAHLNFGDQKQQTSSVGKQGAETGQFNFFSEVNQSSSQQQLGNQMRQVRAQQQQQYKQQQQQQPNLQQQSKSKVAEQSTSSTFQWNLQAANKQQQQQKKNPQPAQSSSQPPIPSPALQQQAQPALINKLQSDKNQIKMSTKVQSSSQPPVPSMSQIQQAQQTFNKVSISSSQQKQSGEKAGVKQASSQQPPVPQAQLMQQAQQTFSKVQNSEKNSNGQQKQSSQPEATQKQALSSQPPVPSTQQMQQAQQTFSKVKDDTINKDKQQQQQSQQKTSVKSSQPPVPSMAQMQQAQQLQKEKITVKQSSSSQPPVPSMAQVQQAQQVFDKVQNKQKDAVKQMTSTSSSSQPPVPSTAQLQQAQQTLDKEKPAVKQPSSSQPPVPSLAQMQQAQQVFNKVQSKSSTSSSSQPPVPSLVQMQQAQQVFNKVQSKSSTSSSAQPPVPSMAQMQQAQQVFNKVQSESSMQIGSTKQESQVGSISMTTLDQSKQNQSEQKQQEEKKKKEQEELQQKKKQEEELKKKQEDEEASKAPVAFSMFNSAQPSSQQPASPQPNTGNSPFFFSPSKSPPGGEAFAAALGLGTQQSETPSKPSQNPFGFFNQQSTPQKQQQQPPSFSSPLSAQQTPSQPAFGFSSFGQPQNVFASGSMQQQQSQPAFGNFGQGAAQSAPAFGQPSVFGGGSTFGTPSSFGQTSGFGQQSGFGLSPGFGQASTFSQQTPQTPNTGSSGGFGQTSGFGQASSFGQGFGGVSGSGFAGVSGTGFGNIGGQSSGFGGVAGQSSGFGQFAKQGNPGFGGEQHTPNRGSGSQWAPRR